MPSSTRSSLAHSAEASSPLARQQAISKTFVCYRFSAYKRVWLALVKRPETVTPRMQDACEQHAKAMQNACEGHAECMRRPCRMRANGVRTHAESGRSG